MLYPDMEDYELAFHLSSQLRDIGRPVQAIDLLVASMCINRGFGLATKDRGYERIKAVRPDFKLKLRQ